MTAGCIAVLNLPGALLAQKVATVPKWQRFELALKSSRNYANPFQDAQMRVLFVSPLGQTNRVYGFWDGGRTWRVRYRPDFPGRWTYYTMCSDTSNTGLHDRSGEFLCTAFETGNRFSEHGPVQVARDNQHFEHADRTPFLWLGDAAWNAAGRATARDWNDYVKLRAEQKFNVVQWKLPSAVFRGRSRIEFNLELIRQLEARIESASHAGLLNAIVPLWEIGVCAGETLPEDQAVVLLRYCLARWDSYPVAWILAFEADDTGNQAARWQQIGRAVFGSVSHSPVLVLPGESTWVLDNFRRERWVDALGVQTAQATDEDSLPWLLKGPLTLERSKSPARPLITLSPPAKTADSPFSASGLSRKVLWWNLLLNTPAGISSGASPVANWENTSKTSDQDQPWRQAMTLPSATAIAPLSDFFADKDFWRLQPVPHAVVAPPGKNPPGHQVVAAGTEARDLILAYTPENRTVILATRALPNRARAGWFDPRTGATTPANSVGGTGAYSFGTPGPGDWLLTIHARK